MSDREYNIYTIVKGDDNKPELLCEHTVYSENILIKSPEDAVKIIDMVFDPSRFTEEHIYVISTLTSGEIAGLFDVSHGTGDNSLMGTREIFQRVLLTNGTGLIVAHNHPSGVVTPSTQDDRAYRQMKDACRIMGYNLLDFLILGDGYYSYKEVENELHR